MGQSVAQQSGFWCFGLSSVDSHTGEMRMSYDLLFVIARDFMAASVLVGSMVPGLAPRHRNLITHTSKLSVQSHAFASWGPPKWLPGTV